MKILMCLVMMLAPLMAAEEEGFQPLFDGKTLKGWDGDPRLWSVKDGAIVGSTDRSKIPGVPMWKQELNSGLANPELMPNTYS